MKRDMTLVREILSYVEAQPAKQTLGAIEGISCDNPDVLAEHLSLMIGAGLIDGEVYGDGSFLLRGLTWAGHDFLSTIKNEKVWKKVLQKIRDMGTDLTLDIVTDLAKSYLKQEIGLP